ncbi:TetR/AcrR family transcriptional regulator [Saccharothrix longispora]|uniref:AcrR family transcriptional regulator n=1 Tax=Saccharothrix longispora TaxID=33920 RepID=A0ABU1PPI8_9PSEU|nr:TetR family transcriptional regulator [Saccharothrix longispora]MDR6592548.1 AcrR family transcriptional regulator [Saccharothrix longispora]
METVGRRERKKAQTRQALAEAAMTLFLERGYDNVTVAEIAAAADTALGTVFSHFPDGKESLIFDDGAQRTAALVAAVRDRPSGTTILRALRRFLADRGPFRNDPSVEFRRRTELIVDTPALRGYQLKLWLRGQDALAEAIAAECGRSAGDMDIRALARYVLTVPDLAGAEPDPRAALDVIFDMLEQGWREA